jgi:hypothetical protein
MAYTTRTHGDSKPVFAIDIGNGSGSATTGTPVALQGPKLDFFSTDLGADAASQMGTLGAVEAVLRTIEQLATVHFYQVEATSGAASFAVYPVGAWTASTLQSAIQGLGTVNTYDLSGATVANNGFKLA